MVQVDWFVWDIRVIQQNVDRMNSSSYFNLFLAESWVASSQIWFVMHVCHSTTLCLPEAQMGCEACKEPSRRTVFPKWKRRFEDLLCSLQILPKVCKLEPRQDKILTPHRKNPQLTESVRDPSLLVKKMKHSPQIEKMSDIILLLNRQKNFPPRPQENQIRPL